MSKMFGLIIKANTLANEISHIKSQLKQAEEIASLHPFIGAAACATLLKRLEKAKAERAEVIKEKAEAVHIDFGISECRMGSCGKEKLYETPHSCCQDRSNAFEQLMESLIKTGKGVIFVNPLHMAVPNEDEPKCSAGETPEAPKETVSPEQEYISQLEQAFVETYAVAKGYVPPSKSAAMVKHNNLYIEIVESLSKEHEDKIDELTEEAKRNQ